MKITAKLLSIPPYLSTSWSNIASLFVKKEVSGVYLVVAMLDGSHIEIPHLSQGEIDAIFAAHAQFSESDTEDKNLMKNAISFGIPFKMDGSTLDGLTPGAMQHNPDQADLPPLPPEILHKVGTIIQAIGVSEVPNLEGAVDGCNCIYCQLARAVQGQKEEEVTADDLHFRDWEIKQKDAQLYHVVNPLDQAEYYDVFLGNPIGCTCGQKNCEHIRAVLNEPF